MGRNARKGPLALLSTNAIKRRGSLTRQIECIAISRDTSMHAHACMLCKFHSPGSVFIYLSDVCLFLMLNLVIFFADQHNIGSWMKR